MIEINVYQFSSDVKIKINMKFISKRIGSGLLKLKLLEVLRVLEIHLKTKMSILIF